MEEQLIQVDKDFAQLSKQKGFVAAFQEYISAEGTLFDPVPVQLATWVERRKNAVGKLDWNPDLAGASLAGDMGFTSGPWIYSAEDGNKGFGHYVTVWGKNSLGQYKAIVDIGIQYAEPSSGIKDLNTLPKSCGATGVADKDSNFEDEKKQLLMADQNFSRMVLDQGLRKAYESFTDYEFKWFLNNQLPIKGQIQAMDDLNKENHMLSDCKGWENLGFDLAESKEFGYTFGKMNPFGKNGQTANHYLRVWKKSYDGAWLVALEVII